MVAMNVNDEENSLLRIAKYLGARLVCSLGGTDFHPTNNNSTAEEKGIRLGIGLV
jgi:hypothetical protein